MQGILEKLEKVMLAVGGVEVDPDGWDPRPDNLEALAGLSSEVQRACEPGGRIAASRLRDLANGRPLRSADVPGGTPATIRDLVIPALGEVKADVLALADKYEAEAPAPVAAPKPALKAWQRLARYDLGGLAPEQGLRGHADLLAMFKRVVELDGDLPPVAGGARAWSRQEIARDAKWWDNHPNYPWRERRNELIRAFARGEIRDLKAFEAENRKYVRHGKW